MNTAVTDVATHSEMKNDQLSQADHQCAILLRIPTPESTPGLIGPDATEDGADQTEEGRETHDAVDHALERFGGSFVQ